MCTLLLLLLVLLLLFMETETYETNDKMIKVYYLLTASTATEDGGGKWKQIAGIRPSRPVELQTRHLVTELESRTIHSSPELTYVNNKTHHWSTIITFSMCLFLSVQQNYLK